jgi:hypothetical protein
MFHDQPEAEATGRMFSGRGTKGDVMAKSKDSKSSAKKSRHEAEDVDEVPQSKARKSTAVVDDEPDEGAEDAPSSKAKPKTGTDKKTKHLSEDDLDDADDVEGDDQEEPIPADYDEQAKTDGDDGSDEKAKESIDEGPKPPRAKLTRTAILLILLNWIMVPTFLGLAYLDSTVRTQYAYRTMLNYIQANGLPLKSEEDFPSISNETRPRLKMSSDQLTEVVKKRTGKSFKDFQPVEETIEKPIPFRVRPSDMATDYLKRDVFQGIPDPVATLDEAIEKLQVSIPTAIKAAADEVVAKQKSATDEDKRDVIRKIMLPLAWNVWQVEKLDDKLAKTKGKDLDAALDDAAQRRMYYDLLAPINVYNPGEIDEFKDYKIERITFEEYDLEKIKEFLKERLAAAIAEKYNPKVHLGNKYWKDGLDRDSIEKRHKIGFILFALSQVSVPTLDKKLVRQGDVRAQIISGLDEFTNASIQYVRTKRILEGRLVAAIKADRQGDTVMVNGKAVRLRGFIDEYEDKIDDLVKIAEQVDTEQKRLADLKVKYADFQKIYVQKVDQHKKALDQLLEARKTTANYAKDLRVLQEQLHRALVELSDAADYNYRLYEQIRDLELGKKGGKK